MSLSTVPRHRPIGFWRRWLLAGAGLALLVASTIGVWSFAWPDAAARGEYAIGPVDDFPSGSVMTYLISGGRLLELSVGDDYGRRPSRYPALGTGVVHIARFPDGEFRIFSGAAPFRDSTIVWFQLDDLDGLFDDWTGLFAEPRRGTRWAIDGTRVFGPAPRGLDTYSFRVRADGVLVIDLADLTEGVGSYELPAPYDVTSEDWPTSGWPSR